LFQLSIQPAALVDNHYHDDDGNEYEKFQWHGIAFFFDNAFI